MFQIILIIRHISDYFLDLLCKVFLSIPEALEALFPNQMLSINFMTFLIDDFPPVGTVATLNALQVLPRDCNACQFYLGTGWC